ncbi:MAG TPA: rhodanese-like domain-containing protein [Blastocatellia bacterium]|nr:rhodanese-like domain-containing protein [Blastocatellia bacterium]
MNEISARELKHRMDAGEKFRLIDVREVPEYEYAKIEGAELIPLSEFQSRYQKELNPDDDIVIYCHHGMRSAQACMFLHSQGYKNLTNLRGGIEDWSSDVDESVPHY